MMNIARLSRLMLPLIARAEASQGSTFCDIAAAQVLNRLGVVLLGEARSPKLALHIQQTQWIDHKVNRFLQAHPCGHGIELDSGLSTRFHRLSAALDWPRFSWQLINSHEVTDCIHYAFSQTDNFRCVATETALQSLSTYLGWSDTKTVVLIAGENQPLGVECAQQFIAESLRVFNQQKIRSAIVIIGHSQTSLLPIVSSRYSNIRIVDELNLVKTEPWYTHWARCLFQTEQTEPAQASTLSCLKFFCD